MNIKKIKALKYIRALVDEPLCYGLKSPDMDLYDFGFGQFEEVIDSNGKRKVCTHTLHITCRFEIIERIGKCHIHRYYEDTPSDKFNSDVKRLIGYCVKRVALSDKNDLWLDFGDYWIVFATVEDGEESWRLFSPGIDEPHLVGSDLWLDFQ